jgi:protein-glutamine gamma-glutamyltransferase
MSALPRRFRSELLMLLGVASLLAIAEQNWWYAIAVFVSGVVAWGSLAYRSRPLLSARGGQVFALAAFGVLLAEWGWIISVPTVIALSHFMILICISKWLVPRTRRDDAMMLILLLLLLVVGAIVGGNLVFPLVLTIYMIVGYRYMIGYHLDREAARAGLRNAQIQGVPPSDSPMDIARGIGTPALSIGAATLIIGVVTFIAMPRVGAGMFGQVPQPAVPIAISGFARSIEFGSIAPIEESDKLVMRVGLTDEYGNTVGGGIPLYLRGEVLDRYTCRLPRNWGWRRSNTPDENIINYDLASQEDGPPSTCLFPETTQLPTGPVLLLKCHLEPTDDLTLFSSYPAIEISSSSLTTVRKWVDTQILHASRPIRKSQDYTIKLPAVPASLANVLAEERAQISLPVSAPPDLPPEQRDRILGLIAEQTRGIGSPDIPENRLAFVRRLEAFLQSDSFSYTRQPPAPPIQGDPVSHFLFETRRGHCEYFASALAMLCQMKGIPARVVVGYYAVDYNTLGRFYLVRKKDAHAWVEAFIPGMDWMTFDPTPSSTRRTGTLKLYQMKLRVCSDFLQFYWTDRVLSFDSESRQRLFEEFSQWLRRPARDQGTLIGAVAAFVRELFGWRLDLTWHERLVYWVFTILFITLVVLLTYVLVSVGRRMTALSKQASQTWRARRGERNPEVEFYHRFCRLLTDAGFTRRPDQTPAEFAAELADHHVGLGEAPALVQAYYEVAFGGRRLSPEHNRTLEEFLAQVRRLAGEARRA